ncbi:hypothetical protein EV121DRAFT_215955, partial [Schizophyllum commune]
SHKDAGGFYAKEDKRHFAPFLTPPSSPSFNQHPTPSSTAVDSPPNVVSPRTPASDQSTPVYTGTHLPQDADDVKTGEASKKDDEGKSMNEDEDEDADAEGEVDDGEWVLATQGGRLPSTTLEEYSLQHALPPSSPSPAVPPAYNAARLETSCTQPVFDDASNAHQHHHNSAYIGRTDCADLLVNSIDAGSDDSQRQVRCEHRVRHPPAVADHGAAVVADATLDALNTADVLNAGTHGEHENVGSFAPFANFDIFSPSLPLDPSSWTATQAERHTDFSPVFSTSRRSPYSFTEADLCNDNADDASSFPPSFGSQRGSGQMIFGPQYSDAAQQLWGDMYANQVFLPSGMQMTCASIFLPAGPLHNRRAPSGRSNYAAPPFVHARSAAPAGNAIQSSRDAQFYPTPMQWTSPSQFPAPSRPAKGKGKAIASDDEQGPSEHPRPIAKLPSRPRNRTLASSRRTSAAAANGPPLEYQRQGVHHGRGQTQASADPSCLPAYSSSVHAPTEIASTSRSATSATYSYDSFSFASRSQLGGVPASSTTPALPTQQDYMTEFRVDLRASSALATAHTSDVTDCAWVGLDGRVCGFRYHQNVMKDNAMWEAVHEHLKMHKNEPFKGDYDPRGNLSLGPGNKLKKPKDVDDRATNPHPKPQNKNGCKAIPGQGKTSKKKSAKVYDDIKVELVRCRMQDPRTGILCGIEKQHRAMAIHVCQDHYGMTVEKDRKRRYNMKVAEERAAKRARH